MEIWKVRKKYIMTSKQADRINECISRLSDIADKYMPLLEIVEAEDNKESKSKSSLDGKWIWHEEWSPSTTEYPAECECAGWWCPECKEFLEDIVGGYWDDIDNPPIKVKFCPNCGAKMFEGVNK